MSMANQPVLIFERFFFFWVNQKRAFLRDLFPVSIFVRFFLGSIKGAFLRDLFPKILMKVGVFSLLPRFGKFIWLRATHVIVNAPF